MKLSFLFCSFHSTIFYQFNSSLSRIILIFRKVPATELFSALNQPAQANHLKSMGVDMLLPKVSKQNNVLGIQTINLPRGFSVWMPHLWRAFSSYGGFY